MTQSEVRVRYAPSPTGHLHIGNARTALFNYLFARNQNGKFIIRIEDTDLKRNMEGGEENQFAFLKWLGMDWDESVDKDGGYGPYRQTERLEIYKKYWQELIDQGKAYYCFCTEEELEAEREAQTARGETPRYSGKCSCLSKEEADALRSQGRVPSVRFKVPKDQSYRFNDMVKGEVEFESNEIGDFVIVKKDGIPTYNFAVVIDDYLMEITHVLRGDDHISNTPRQLMIYQALGWDAPIFGHMTLIVNEQHKKLSKRDESIVQFIEQYRDLGYLPEALFNFIALLGWSPAGEQEIYSKEELIQIFDANRLSKSPAVFDTNKLAWMNNEYMKKVDLQKVVDLCILQLEKANRIQTPLTSEQREWVERLVALYKEQLHFAQEIVELTTLFFQEKVDYNEEAEEILSEEQVPTVLQAFKSKILGEEEYTPENINRWLKEVQKETGHKGKKLFMPIRVAATGQSHGRDLDQTLFLLGKERILDRLNGLL